MTALAVRCGRPRSSTFGFLLGLTTTCCFLVLTSAQDGVKLEICQFEAFESNCPADTVVLVEQATYGRRVTRPSKCIDRPYDQTDCLADVLPYADHVCSGRRRCRIVVPDVNLERYPHGCPRDLKNNLEISYRCVAVHPGALFGRGQSCDRSALTVGSSSGGLLSSVVADETGSGGSKDCPWTISVQPGQTVVLSLIDFGLWKAYGSDGGSTRQRTDSRGGGTTTCRGMEYGVISEQTTTNERKLCRAELRESVVFRSNSNVVNVFFTRSQSLPDSDTVQFLVKYEAVGCADIHSMPDAVVRRTGDSTVIRCAEGSGGGREQTVRCVDGQWSPPGLVNCSWLTPTTAAATSSFEFGAFALSRNGLLIIVVVGIALLVSLCIVIIGIICLCRFPSRKRFSQSDADLQYAPAASAKYRDPSLANPTWTELHPMLSKMDYATTGSCAPGGGRGGGGVYMPSERDYATTLQMRRTAAMAAHPSSIVLRPTPFDAGSMMSPSTIPNCTCPLHGTQPSMMPPGGFDDPMTMMMFLPQQPQQQQQQLPSSSTVDAASSPDAVTTPTRFSSFRPRVEHIYEVPKFADGDGDDVDDDVADCPSTLYNELDPRSFGTLGRRLPTPGAAAAAERSGSRRERGGGASQIGAAAID